MMNDTEEVTMTQHIRTDNKEDGSTAIHMIQTKKTVTRRRPDLLYKYENGQKVPKYVFMFAS
jgi:type VI protein secretion system component Hcp